MKDIDRLITETISAARGIYGDGFIPLHRPVFEGNERKYLVDCIDSNFVSSVGIKVTEFENQIAEFTKTKYAVATVNGTAALHVALEVVGVVKNDEVLTQAVTFIATCNALSYAGAYPVFIDVDKDTLGMSPKALEIFLQANAEKRNGACYNKSTRRRISACVPMHTFGFPCQILEIATICSEWGITLVEDCAESLGTYCGKSHTGTFGQLGILSFNGNKLITTGGGGMIFTDNEELAKRAKHKTTTSKIPHAYEFVHDEIGYNYRMPNLNAALGCAQMERLPEILDIKRDVAVQWNKLYDGHSANIVTAGENNIANNWLNTIVLDSKSDRDNFLERTNASGVMTRPLWTLMSKLNMFKNCQSGDLTKSRWLEDRVVNVPSSVPDGKLKKLRD